MIRLRAAIAVAAALFAVAPAGPAAASTEPKQWIMARCLVATLSTAVTYEPGVGRVTVKGTAAECQAPTASTHPVGFGVAVFDRPNRPGVILDWNIRTFPVPSGSWQPTPVDFGAAAVPARTGRYAVCVAYRPPASPGTHGRPPIRFAACVLVSVTRDGQGWPTVTAVPLRTSSPLLSECVFMPATYTGATRPYGPGVGEGNPPSAPPPPPGNCGTCF